MLARVVRHLADAAAGRSTPPPPELIDLLEALDGEPTPAYDNYAAAQFAVICNDGHGWPPEPSRYWRNIQRSRRAQLLFGPLENTITSCAFWQDVTAEPPPVIRNDVPVLIVQAERDNNTPLAGARQLHGKLTGSRLVTADVRTHGVYVRGAEGNEPVRCIEDAVNAYFRDGTFPDRDGRCSDPAASDLTGP